MQGITTNKDVRTTNRKNIVNALFRYGPMTKQQIADHLHLSLPTVSVILKELGEKGLVAKGDKLESSGGRPASHITLVFDARLSVGVSVSSEYTHFALVDLGPKVAASERHNIIHDDTPEFWADIHEKLEGFISRNVPDRSRLLGVGVAIYAPMVCDNYVDLPVLRVLRGKWDLDAIFSAFGEKTVINNVSKMAGYAQAWGGGVELGDFVYLMVGRGIGGAIIADRRVVGDISKNAEFGHIVLDEGGPLCTCGQRGCFGRLCSIPALEGEAGMRYEEFFSQLEAGNAHCAAVWKRYLEYLAMGVNNIRLIFDTDIVIGGELSEYIGRYAGELRAMLTERNPFGDNGDYLHISTFGEYDAAFGAALMHIDAFLS